MIGDIAYKAAQLNAHLGDKILEQTPGIVLIDELDLHLHPTWAAACRGGSKKNLP